MASFALPNGSRVYIESAAGAAIVATAVSNASQAVVALPTGHGLINGDIVRLANSTWNQLDGVVARVASSAAGSVVLEDIDTSNTDDFPQSEDVTTTLYRITSWTEIPQITTVANEGNEQQFYQFQFLSDERQRNLPTFKSASTITYTFAHDSSLSLYPILRAADKRSDTRAMYMNIPKAKEKRYWSAIPSFNDMVTTTINEIEVVTLAASLQSSFVFYKEA